MKCLILTLLLGPILFFSNAYAQDYTQMGLPEGAKYRIGKGTISGNIVFSPDGTRFAVGSSIGVWMYDAHTGEELALFTGHTEAIWAVAFSPDGKMLASGATRKPRWWREDSEIFLWDADTGEHLATFKRPPEIASEWEAVDQLDITSLAFSPDGKILASAGSEGTILLWDLAPIMQTPNQERNARVASSADVNEDGIVNILDLTFVASRLGQDSPDLNGDGLVNILDLVLVAQQSAE